jgi:hypothetical protein
MNERTIKIANTKTQQRYTIQTSSTTLGEIQDQMSAQGIDFAGMSFTEGLSKTQLIGRDSLLPTNVMYKGQPTNDLVMLLTNTTKNIASGAISRKEAFRLVKEMNLQDVIAEGEGKNYTLVKTDILEEYINDNDGFNEKLETITNAAEQAKEVAEETAKVENPLPDIKTAPHPEAVEWYYMGLKAMLKNHLLYTDDIAVIADLTTELYKKLKEEEPKITDSDIDDIIASI